MKKLLVLIAMVICFSLSFNTYTNAKDESKADLKRKIAQLEGEVKKLKKQIPTVSSGTIYSNGVKSGSSRFVTMGSKNYVEIDNIIPLLTSYTDQQVTYDNKGKNLYLGVMPSKGVIGLTNMDYYAKTSYVDIDSDKFIMNNSRYSKNIHSIFDGTITYKIDGKYSSLRFLYGVGDINKVKGNITITGDGNELFHSGELDYQAKAKQASINVKGIKYLKITFSQNAGIANPTLSPK